MHWVWESKRKFVVSSWITAVSIAQSASIWVPEICRTKWIPRAGCDLAFVVRGRSLLGQLGAEKMLVVLKLRTVKLTSYNYGIKAMLCSQMHASHAQQVVV